MTKTTTTTTTAAKYPPTTFCVVGLCGHGRLIVQRPCDDEEMRRDEARSCEVRIPLPSSHHIASNPTEAKLIPCRPFFLLLLLLWSEKKKKKKKKEYKTARFGKHPECGIKSTLTTQSQSAESQYSNALRTASALCSLMRESGASRCDPQTQTTLRGQSFAATATVKEEEVARPQTGRQRRRRLIDCTPDRRSFSPSIFAICSIVQ